MNLISTSVVEHVVAQRQDGALAGLFVAPERVEICPADLAPTILSPCRVGTEGVIRRLRASRARFSARGGFNGLAAIPESGARDEVVDAGEQRRVEGQGNRGLRDDGMRNRCHHRRNAVSHGLQSTVASETMKRRC